MSNKFIPLEDIVHNLVDWRCHYTFDDLFPLLSILMIDDIEPFIFNHYLLLILRFICFNSTLVPPPKNLKIRRSFGIFYSFTYDMMFSGHVMTTLLPAYFIFNPIKIYISLILAILCSICSIATREHYTVDVIISWVAVQAVTSLDLYSKKLI